jgi:hypothetical protein
MSTPSLTNNPERTRSVNNVYRDLAVCGEQRINIENKPNYRSLLLKET